MNSATKSKPARVKEKTHHVQVFVRVRSLGTHDRSRTPHVVHCTSNEVTIKDRQELKVIKTFCFDRVFDQNSTQLEVYNHVVRPAVADILKGYNYTVFAYGQSGSGKSYTMAGGRSLDQDVSWDQDPQCGLVPRVLVHLFDELRLLQAEFTLRISLLELCNEDMTDLLSRSGDSSKLRLYEDCNRKGAVFVHGLEEEVLHTRRDLHNVLLKCAARGASSRSHTIFTATVHVKENSVEGDELVRTAKLCLVDLAASDQAGPNNSLLNLGRVLTALVERAPHVPYRESKLTRLLRDALCGRSRASIIGCISPAAPHLDDTIGTLEYVHRARNITVRPELNPKVTKQSLIKMYAEEIERLKRDLEACRTRQGVYLVNEDYSQMISDTDRLNREISEKLASIRAFTDQIHEKQRLLEDLSLHLEDVQAQLRDTRGRLRAQLVCRDETQFLLDRHRHTRDSLLDQAGVLLETVGETTGHLRALHAKLHRTRDISSKNEGQMKQLGEQFSREMQQMAAEVGELVCSFLASAASVRERVGGLLEADMPVSASMRNKLQALASSHDEAVNHIQAIVQKMAADANTLVERAEKTVLDTTDLDAVLRDYQHVVLPLVQHVCARLQSCSVSVLDTLALLQSKNQKETTLMAESWNNQNESALRLQKEFLKEFEKRHLEKQRMWALIQDLNERQHQSKAELLARMGEMRAALHGCAARGAEYHRVLAEASAERRREAQGCGEADQRLSDHLDHQREADDRLWSDMKACNQQLLADLQGALEQARAVTEEVRTGQAVARGHAAGLAGAGTASWVHRGERMRTSVSAVSARLSADLREAESASGQACEATGAQARCVASQAEQLQEQTRAGSLGLLQQVECSAVPLAAWPARAATGLQWAAVQVSSIAEDHITYQPSGNTPERKEYEYPKALEATSPHDSILEQFRATRNNLQSSPDFLDSTCEEEQVLPSEGNKSQLLPSASSPTDGETSSQSETSSTAAVTGSDVDVSDMMAEDKENTVGSAAQCVSKLPVKMASGNADPCKKVLFPRN